ncbi:hypothetical protein BH23VER1_BH23VER1_31490 [soil metagenome]
MVWQRDFPSEHQNEYPGRNATYDRKEASKLVFETVNHRCDQPPSGKGDNYEVKQSHFGVY